jgi:hypothetical protein
MTPSEEPRSREAIEAELLSKRQWTASQRGSLRIVGIRKIRELEHELEEAGSRRVERLSWTVISSMKTSDGSPCGR